MKKLSIIIMLFGIVSSVSSHPPSIDDSHRTMDFVTSGIKDVKTNGKDTIQIRSTSVETVGSNIFIKQLDDKRSIFAVLLDDFFLSGMNVGNCISLIKSQLSSGESELVVALRDNKQHSESGRSLHIYGLRQHPARNSRHFKRWRGLSDGIRIDCLEYKYEHVRIKISGFTFMSETYHEAIKEIRSRLSDARGAHVTEQGLATVDWVLDNFDYSLNWTALYDPDSLFRNMKDAAHILEHKNNY